jgi:hypothetical protein
MTKAIQKRIEFVKAAHEYLGLNDADLKKGERHGLNRQDVLNVCENYDLNLPQWLTGDKAYRGGRGIYLLPHLNELDDVPAKVRKPRAVSSKAIKRGRKIAEKAIAASTPVIPATPVVENNEARVNMALSLVHDSDLPHAVEHISLIPDKAHGYVPFGHYNDVRTIVKSGLFYPLYITGLSGNGKTMMVEQVCAVEKRECIRVNLTKLTDEDDLIGGMRLINGQTVWQNGPVIHAMERGAVLLLDEVDLADEKIMCLQPVLEGKGIFLKKINRLVSAAPGFNIIATANTKGKGSDDGRFIGTNVMNEAFLERFSVTFEQDYPSSRVEAKILKNVLNAAGVEDNEFVEKLVSWAEVIRKAFAEGAISEIVSTRRLVHICQAYAIFGQNREKAIQLCLNRFDVDTKISFMDFYKKLDESIDPLPVNEEEKKDAANEEVAF